MVENCLKCHVTLDSEEQACPCNNGLCQNCCECGKDCGCSCGGEEKDCQN